MYTCKPGLTYKDVVGVVRFRLTFMHVVDVQKVKLREK